MDYYIMPNKEIECENEFPEKLSQFFEQVGGYGELAEVSQVSEILNIDLSIFQDIEYDIEDESEEDFHWHSIENYLSIIEDFIRKAAKTPFYYTQVIHGTKSDGSSFANEILRVAALSDGDEMARQWTELEKKHEKGYPPDYEFLSSGQLLEDLKILKQTLLCYRDNGATAARIFYM